MSKNITKFWYVLEQLIPFNLTDSLKNEKSESKILFSSEKNDDFPWWDENILPKKFRVST
jgi:hypothetical protein